jgi:hypothetical protein
VVVVPGIMGSELVDATSGTTLWGLSDPRWYVQAWTSSSSLASLHLDEDERDGRYGRVRATRLLRFPAWAPMLQGFEPYTRLLDGLRRLTSHPEAVAEFAYDWRLPVAHNAGLLAEAVHRHLDTWRDHGAERAARGRDPDGGEARLVLVAHSMGGLLARHLTLVPGALDEVRAVVTLGTPFYGSVKAAVLLNSGRGGPLPLPRAKVRDLAATLPGLYDLLPAYRCLDTGNDASQLTPGDVHALGGRLELATAAALWRDQLKDSSFPDHMRLLQVVGAHQPTQQSLTIANGVVTGHAYTCRPAAGGIERVDLAGDGTVPRVSAQLRPAAAMPLAQSHGALAATDEAILVASDVLGHQQLEPWLGGAEIGLEVPDVASVGSVFEITVTGIEHPRDVSCRVLDVAAGRQVLMPRLTLLDGRIGALITVPDVGLYRIEVTGGGASPVSQLTLGCEAQ